MSHQGGSTLNVPSSAPPPPVEAVPPLPAKWGWAASLGGAGVCLLAAVVGLSIDLSALANPPAATEAYPFHEGGPTLSERLKWASGQANQPRSEGELRRLHYEIGRTTPLGTPRIGLVGLGVLAAAAGVWMRRGHWSAWLVGAAAAVLGAFGLPMHWDSLRMLLWVMASVAAVGAVLAYVPPVWRFSLLVPAIVFHFGGILTATTWPETQGKTAWLTNQSGSRVYLPYFRFMYLSNAYHFYSPDPGPASKFLILVEHEVYKAKKNPQTGEYEPELDPDTGEMIPVIDPKTKATRTVAEWVELPKRRTHYRDPLGLTYYRRLSLTELASYSTPGTMLPQTWEKEDARLRRGQNELNTSSRQVTVPGASTFTKSLDGRIHITDTDMSQYRQPPAATRRSVLPSYARHIASEYTKPRTEVNSDGGGPKEEVFWYKVTGMKMFRVEHRIIESQQFLEYDNPEFARLKERNPQMQLPGPVHKDGLSPYHPAMYYPYYMGDFAADGNLKDPNDPLLYWLTPVQYLPNQPLDKPDYKDWMSEYARHKFDWEGK